MSEDHKQHRHILTSQKQQKDQKHYVKKMIYTHQVRGHCARKWATIWNTFLILDLSSLQWYQWPAVANKQMSYERELALMKLIYIAAPSFPASVELQYLWLGRCRFRSSLLKFEID